MTIALWLFPPNDFAAWCELVGEPEVRTYAEYLDLLAAVQADMERLGHDVRRVRMTVAEMIEELAAAGMDNTPGNRAAIVAGYRPKEAP